MIQFKERFDFAPYGEEFKDSYLIYKLPLRGEVLKLEKKAIKLSKELGEAMKGEDIDLITELTNKVNGVYFERAKECFITGNIWDSEQNVQRSMVVEDIDQLPMKIIKGLVNQINGIEKKD